MEGKSIKKWLIKLLIANAVFVSVFLAGYFVFQSKMVQTYIISIITKVVSQKTGTEVSIKKVDIALFSKVILNEVYMSDQQGDTLIYADKMVANIDSLSIFKKRVHFKNILFSQPVVNVVKLDSSYNASFLFSNFSSNGQDFGWRAFCTSFSVKNGRFVYTDSTVNQSFQEFLNIDNISFSLDSVNISGKKLFECKLTDFQLQSSDGLRFKKLSANVIYSDSLLSISKISASTINSYLKVDTLAVDFSGFFSTKNYADLRFFSRIDSLNLAFKDISFFLESFKDKEFRILASGEVRGTVDNFKGRGIKLSLGDFTNISGDFDINGLPEIDQTYLFLNLNESYANINAVRHLDLPIEISSVFNDLPDFFYGLGEFRYKGNFSGFLNDFVAFGTVYSKLGVLRSDISVKPLGNSNVKVNGHLSTQKLNIGKMFSNPDLGLLSLSGSVNGNFNVNNNKYNLKFNGIVDSVDFKDYRYKNIDINGTLRNKLFDGAFAISDPNLKMEYKGKLDLVPLLPIFEFESNIIHANLKKLHLTNDSIATLSAKINANFIGSNIDNVLGELIINDLNYINHIDTLNIEKALLKNESKGHDSSLFVLSSNLIDAEIRGNYNFIDLKNSIELFYSYYFPSLKKESAGKPLHNNSFNFTIDAKDINQISKVFVPNISFERNFKILGSYNSTDQTANIETTIPSIKVNTNSFSNFRVSLDANKQNLKGKFKADRLSVSDGLIFSNFSAEAQGYNDKLSLNFFFNNNNVETYSGSLKTITTFSKTKSKHPLVNIDIEPTKFFLADSVWTLNKAKVIIDSSTIAFDKLKMSNGKRLISLVGKVSKNKADNLTAVVQNIDLTMLRPLMGNKVVYGQINGRAKISDIYNQIKLDLNVVVNDLSIDNNGLLGDLSISGEWENQSETLESEVYLIKNNSTILVAQGYIDPLKAALDLNIKFDKSPISILQVLLPDVFYNQDGLASGSARLYGKLNKLMHDGTIYPDGDISFGINPLKTTYFTKSPVHFRSDSILFRNMNFTDKYGNKGVFNGYIKHKNFVDIKFDMNARAINLLVMNTTSSDNEQFYGTAYANGSVTISGTNNNVVLAGNLTSTRGTNINIPFETTGTAQQYDFVKFVNNEKQSVKTTTYKVVTEGLSLDLDIDVTPDAKVQIIFNSQIGDVIKGEGSGNLQVKMNKNFNIQLYGNYLIEKGDYLFTLQNVINKRFSIESGGTIKWIGDPYNAIIDIAAVYRVKTSLYDLLLNTDDNIDLSKRIPVNCKIQLTDNLMQPKIGFGIELPTAEENIKEKVSQVIVTQEDINKQIISLLLMGRFYTPEFFAGTPSRVAGTDLLGTTTTELLSNQLSNWFSQIIDIFDIGINYRPGNEITSEQIELALSTQFFNDRVTIDGNVANNARQTSTNTSDIIGDLDVKVKLTDNGKLQLKAYTHSNDNLIHDTSPNTQGIGFSYREDFDTFGELFNRYMALFSKKKKINKANSDEPTSK